jgi:hypothetical protein
MFGTRIKSLFAVKANKSNHSAVKASRRDNRHNRVFAEALESRELMSAAVASTSAPMEYMSAPPAVAVEKFEGKSDKKASTSPKITMGVDNNGALQISSNWTQTSNTSANISATLYHKAGRDGGKAMLNVTAANFKATVSVNNLSGINITDNTGGTINFTAGSDVMEDYVPNINITNDFGTVNINSTVPVFASANNIFAADTLTLNARHTLVGNYVVSESGGANLVARSIGSYLESQGYLDSAFYGSYNTTIVAAHGNNIVYTYGGSFTSLGDGQDNVTVYGWGYNPGGEMQVTSSYVDTGAGFDTVSVYGDTFTMPTINLNAGGGVVYQHSQLYAIIVYGGGDGSYSSYGRSSVVLNAPDVLDSTLWNVDYVFTFDGAIDGGGGKG